jgi:hypothetical protein
VFRSASVPPGALEGYEAADSPEVFLRWTNRLMGEMQSGFCLACTGPVSPRVAVAPPGAEGNARSETPERPVATDGGDSAPTDSESYLDSLRTGISLVRGTVVSRAMAATVVANASFGGVLVVPELRSLPRIAEIETLRL